MDGLKDVAVQKDTEILVTAIVGMIGILPTIEGIRAGKNIALANKETLVTAGHIIMPLAKEYGVSILPVDSEHSAIFQSLQGGQHQAVSKILLTASGGPFRGKRGRASSYPGRRCPEASQLGDGTQDHNRLFHDGQQRIGSDRSKVAV